jgi:hypothetical protein
MDLDGTLNVTADSGAVTWGKEDGDDIINSGLFIGRNSSGDPRFVIGSTNSYIYFDGTNVSAVGVDEDDTVGTETNFYSTPGTHIFTISSLLDSISIEIAGAGGGGGGGDNNSAGSSSPGGTSYVYVKQSNDSTRTTFSAAGGAGGAKGSTGQATGGTGGSFGNQGNIGNAASDSTSHSGGAGSTHQVEPAQRPSGSDGGTASGGGGNGAGSGDNGGGGAGGAAGSYYSTTIVKASGHFVSTDYLSIVIPSGGSGGGDSANGRGGTGGSGIVRIKGVIS